MVDATTGEMNAARGRGAAARREWDEAFDRLSAADPESDLGPEDLEILATAAYLLGRVDPALNALSRAHRMHLAADDPVAAVRAGFWTTLMLITRG